MPTAIPDPYYIAFIDEAGDPGLKAVRPIDPAGATEWLCLSAVLIKARQNADVANWVPSILAKANIRRPDLHYRYLSDAQKRIAVNEIAKLPVRAFVLASKNMRGYRNARAETVQSKQWFYNFCVRLLLERVTHHCYQHAAGSHAKGRFVKLVSSQRAVHSYAQTAAYHELLRTQARGGTLFLQKRRIVSEMLDWRLAETVAHKSSAGAQLADVVVSAFYQAADTLSPPKWNDEFAKLLQPIMAKENGSCMDYGLALQPTPPWKAKLNDQQKQIFEYYGYKFWP